MADQLPPPPVPADVDIYDGSFVNDGVTVHRCDECGLPMRYETDYYMLKHRLWARAMRSRPSKKFAAGYLHRACVEKRIGRPLRMADFLLELPINRGFFGFDASKVYGRKPAAERATANG